MLFCIVTFNLWLHFNKLLTYLLIIGCWTTQKIGQNGPNLIMARLDVIRAGRHNALPPPGGANRHRSTEPPFSRLLWRSYLYLDIDLSQTLPASRRIIVLSLMPIGPAVWPTIRNIH